MQKTNDKMASSKSISIHTQGENLPRPPFELEDAMDDGGVDGALRIMT